MSREEFENEAHHSLIVVDCDECSQPDVVTLLKHPKDSPQHYAVLEGHEQLIDEHHEETGHNPEFKHYGGSPDEMLEKACSYARDVDGVDDDAFTMEVRA